MSNIKLTEYSRSAGCGCKIAPSQLLEIIKVTSQKQHFQNLLVGNDTSDDAAVIEIDNGQCIISTNDFFMPIVDDPFTFGQIAAANSISDIYAMGAKPILALGILGFPIDKLSPDIAQQILEGARNICNQANIPLAGGHSIDSLEPFFGLAVTGLAAKKNIKTNANAKNSDVLFLTKPIGSGVLATAHKRKIINETHYNTLVETTIQLNRVGEILGEAHYVNSITDVTGFGLLGHLTEMAKASNLCAEINYNKIPLLEGVEHYLKQFIYPDNTTRNLNAYKPTTNGMNGLEFLTLCDPQTNGGLIISVSKDYVSEFRDLMKESKQKVFEIGIMKDTKDEIFVELI